MFAALALLLGGRFVGTFVFVDQAMSRGLGASTGVDRLPLGEARWEDPVTDLLFFDVDGTLLSAGGVAPRAICRAVHAVSGHDVEGLAWPMAGKTDAQIVLELLEQAGVPRESARPQLSAIWREYLVRLRSAMEEQPPTVLPGVEDLLEALRARRVPMGLLTGNVEAVAWCKLSLVGLDRYFHFGAFGESAEERHRLPALGLVAARRGLGREFAADRVTIVGDTPNDIACGRPLGIRVVAVATGPYSPGELACHEPSEVLDNFGQTRRALEALLGSSALQEADELAGGEMARAERVLVGGVNSPVRAFQAVAGTPRFVVRGHGARIWDSEGRELIDLVCSWGPLILGHAPPAILRAAARAAARGTSFGAPCALEVQLAERVVSMVPSIEKVRFVSSGTEATMSAIRLARAATGRDPIVKMDGHYHGHADAFLVAAGSGAMTLGTPDSPGVPPGVARDTLVVPYNDADALEEVLRATPCAAVILEPIAGNMGVVPPRPGYLERVREVTRATGTLLIFDEVISGFRAAPGGAQELLAVLPDITTLGKIIGGGFPVGAYGASAELMAMIAPEGPVYQAGTLSGNPVAMAAGIATLDALVDGEVHCVLEGLGARLEAGLRGAGGDRPMTINRQGSLLTLFFCEGEVTNLAGAKASDHAAFGRYHAHMLDQGIYLPPSGYEAWFLSAAHDGSDIDQIVAAHGRAIDRLDHRD